jgi:hypothetical protein
MKTGTFLLGLGASSIVALFSCGSHTMTTYVRDPMPSEVKKGAPMLGKTEVLDFKYAKRRDHPAPTIVRIIDERTDSTMIAYAVEVQGIVRVEDIHGYRVADLVTMMPSGEWDIRDSVFYHKDWPVTQLAMLCTFDRFGEEIETRERGVLFEKNDSTTNVAPCQVRYLHKPITADSVFFYSCHDGILSALGVYRDVIDVTQSQVSISAVTKSGTWKPCGTFTSRSREGLMLVDLDCLDAYRASANGDTLWYKGEGMPDREQVLELAVFVNEKPPAALPKPVVLTTSGE